MKNTLVPVQNYLLGGGVNVYPSTIRDVLLKGQNELGTHHYIEPYLLQAIRLTFERLMKEHKWIFVVKQDIYSPNNTSVKKLIKCYPRFAVAEVTIRNGSNIRDDHIYDDVNYAELLDKYNHAHLYVFDPKKHLKSHQISIH